MAVDGNLSYQIGANGDYLTVRKKGLENILPVVFVPNAADSDVPTITLEESHTSSTVFVPVTTAASKVVLPAAKAGINFKIVCAENNGAHAITFAGTFKGSVLAAGAVASATGTVLTLVGSKFKVGDVINLLCDGTNWLVSGQLITASSVTITA